MRRSLPFLLAGLIALVAYPALANQVVVRGSVPHHHHFFFRNHHNRILFGSPFFFPTTPFVAVSPFAQTTPFVSTAPFVTNRSSFVLSMNPFFFDGGIFPTSSFGAFSGGFGAPVALGGDGEFAGGGASGEPRIIVVAAPFAGPPPRPAEPAHATIEQTPFGVTIIRGSGSGR